MTPFLRPIAAALLLLSLAASVLAQPSSVTHTPTSSVFSVPGATQRTPATPRENETVTIYFRVCCQFTYDRVALYYTTTGGTPGGTFGTGTVGTLVLTGGSPAGPITFVANEVSGGQTFDWWRATLPAASYSGQTISYKISAWKPGVGSEVFANSGAAYSYTAKLAWPGAGAGQPSPSAGYPPVSFWKEEAVFGNTYTAGMLDQNGTVYDMHFPTPGGVFGVGTRNEGYSDGGDTFPALLPAGWRGQMHLNQAMPGISINGLTHWLSNPNGVSYDQVSQSYNPTSNTIHTTSRLYAGGLNLGVEQYDFSPAGITFPNNTSGQPERHIYIKRLILTLPALTGLAGSPGFETNVYWYVDPALNGGDDYDTMFWDASKGAMTAYDKTTRTVTGTGNSFASPNEYNPTTNPGYTKNIALYLSSCMKIAGSNTLAADNWRDTSSDNGQGWMGTTVFLTPGVPTEIDILMVGSSYRPPNPLTDPMPASDGVYDNNITPVLNWFASANIASVQAQTDAYWTNWLTSGTRASTPDANLNKLMDRGLLGTALHVDGFNGGVIAGFHNGAYPYVWPRDAVYAAITLARTGHIPEAEGVYAYMKNTTYRDFESWGRKGFWKQKYSTDGYVIWGAPQIDETAVFPWGVWFQYRMTNDPGVLTRYVEQVRDAVQSCTRSSGDGRLFLTGGGGGGGGACGNDSPGLMHSNNVWEDSYATFIYSNANIVRGLRDAGNVFNALSLASERDDASAKAASVKSGLDARMACNTENTDISQLGVVYPFDVYAPNDALVTPFVNRINSQLVRQSSPTNDGIGWTGLVDRYAGDSYWGNGSASSPWGAGPWFLSSAWYGLYLAERADVTSGKADIDAHKSVMNLLVQHLGPNGFGSEQIAPRGIPSMGAPWNTGSLLYPGQNDFSLETAWPNAWESMSTFVDAVMAFLHYEPDAPSNTMAIEPKLPTGWPSMTFTNVTLQNAALGQTHKTNITLAETGTGDQTLTIVNTSGFPLTMRPTLKLLPGRSACTVTVNGVATAYTPSSTGRLDIQPFSLATGAGATTTVLVKTVAGSSPDWNHSGQVNVADIFDFLASWFTGNGDFNGVGGSTVQDIFDFLAAWFVGC
jgi:hypothetical protein